MRRPCSPFEMWRVPKKSSQCHQFDKGAGLYTLELPQEALSFLCKLCRQARRFETGGVLIGHYDDQLRRAIVTQIWGPAPDSKAGPTWFVRGTRGLTVQLEHTWYKTGDYYLGEWHHHPWGTLAPSTTDISQMRTIASDMAYRCPEPLLIIVGSCHPRQRPELPSLRSFVFPHKEVWQELILQPLDRNS